MRGPEDLPGVLYTQGWATDVASVTTTACTPMCTAHSGIAYTHAEISHAPTFDPCNTQAYSLRLDLLHGRTFAFTPCRLKAELQWHGYAETAWHGREVTNGMAVRRLHGMAMRRLQAWQPPATSCHSELAKDLFKWAGSKTG